MRTRRSFPLIALLLLTLVILGALHSSPADARLQTDGTPVGTKTDDATPVAAQKTKTPESGIVTLVLWYQQNETGEILLLSPTTNDGFVFSKGEAKNDNEEGRVVFEESRNEGYPRIRIGDGNYFDAAPLYVDDPSTVQRWFYYNDDATLRPATMV
ncbi:MAG TPA: hypothetical protein PK819_04075, partial [Thermomicrobiales bacterium]|nr:hypothetical protein [Thermomicrobiales bacterium]